MFDSLSIVISIAHHVRLIDSLDVGKESKWTAREREGGYERTQLNFPVVFDLPIVERKNQHVLNTYRCSVDKMINLE